MTAPNVASAHCSSHSINTHTHTHDIILLCFTPFPPTPHPFSRFIGSTSQVSLKVGARTLLEATLSRSLIPGGGREKERTRRRETAERDAMVFARSITCLCFRECSLRNLYMGALFFRQISLIRNRSLVSTWLRPLYTIALQYILYLYHHRN